MLAFHVKGQGKRSDQLPLPHYAFRILIKLPGHGYLQLDGTVPMRKRESWSPILTIQIAIKNALDRHADD